MTSEKKAEALRAVKFTFFSVSAGIIQILSFTLFKELLHRLTGRATSFP